MSDYTDEEIYRNRVKIGEKDDGQGREDSQSG